MFNANAVRTPAQSVNTNGIQFYADASTLNLNFWSTTVVAKIAPAKPQAERTEGSRYYDYQQAIRMTLPADKAVALGHLIEDKIIPACEKGEAAHVGLVSSKVNMIYVSTGVDETGSVNPMVSIFNNIDESKKAGKALSFVFQKRRLFSKYNPETGESDYDDTPMMELQALADFLKNSILLFGHTAHASNYYNADANFKRDDFINQAASRMNFTVQQPVHYASRQAQKDPWSSDNSASNQENAAPVSSASSMDDISGLL